MTLVVKLDVEVLGAVKTLVDVIAVAVEDGSVLVECSDDKIA